MEVTCNHCNKKYRIDESKLPETGKAFIKCANCQERIEIDLLSTRSSYSLEKQSLESFTPVEYFEPGTRTALIYCRDIQAKMEMEQILASIGFEVRSVRDKSDACHHFRYNIFDVVIIYQQGPDPEEELLGVLEYFNKIPPDIRRKVLIVYIYLTGNRYNLMEAFSRAADVTLNPMDISKLDKLLNNLLQEKEAKYRVFFECMRKVEEAVI